MTRGTSTVRGVALRALLLCTATLCALAVCALPAAASAPAAQYVVTIVVPAQSPVAGVAFAITGSVSPGAAGQDVQLQRDIAGTFKTVATTALSASSTYSFTENLGTAGAYSFRVLKPKSGSIAAGVSVVKRIWVTGNTLLSGRVMRGGDMLYSSAGTYRLTMRPNGNLEMDVTVSGRPLWLSRTGGHPGAYALLQKDGDLVVFAPDGSVLMHTNSGGHPSGTYSVTMQQDSNLVIYTPGGTSLWSSRTMNNRLAPNEGLKPGDFLTSPGGQFQAVMQTGGAFVIYDTWNQYTLWTSNTAVPGSAIVMQADGDLMLRGPSGQPLWSSRTSGHAGAYAVMQDDGNFVVFQGLDPIWATEGVNGVLGDDYPTNLRNAARDTMIDPWRFYNRECTSFVAWRMNNANHVDFNNFMGGGRFGNANTWDDNARKLGYTVNNTPARGAIAESDSMGGSGHVAWVASVGNGTVTVEDYNYTSPGNYGFRTVPTSTYIYIHIKDL